MAQIGEPLRIHEIEPAEWPIPAEPSLEPLYKPEPVLVPAEPSHADH